jgi:hypothetical protein
MHNSESTHGRKVRGEDLVRGTTFTGFWGFVFYLLSTISLISAQRSQPFRLHARPLLLGLAINVGSFITLGLSGLVAQSLLRGKSSTDQSREDIGEGRFERIWWLSGLASALGSVVPFALALASLRAAERLSGERAFDSRGVSWPQALGVMALLSGVVALCVARITSWVAQDARSGEAPDASGEDEAAPLERAVGG